MTSPIPTAALDDRLGWFGTAGSGKTYNAGASVEQLLDKGARVVIVDPLDVWFGLRLIADGTAPSRYPVAIFGGAHADLPLNEHAGALIGETVASMSESCIVSLGGLGTKALERRFMLSFLTAFYGHASGEPVHIVFDEGDMWAPQKLLDKEGEAAKLLGMMETIVRRGRVKGFIPWLISQRPAVISKDVLSQVDGLIAFKLTSSQDRDALEGWIEGQADRAEWKAIRAQLPTMERGTGVVWIPGRGVMTTTTFPPKRTFDSSRTPKRGEKTARSTTQLAPLDLPALQTKLATVAKDAEANDPKVLRKRIAELERELTETGKPVTASDQQLAHEYDRGHAAGWRDGYRVALHDLQPHVDRQREALDRLTEAMINPPGASMPIQIDSPDLREIEASKPAPEPRPVKQTAQPESNCQPSANNISGNSTLPRAERLILTALAQYPQGRSKAQVAILTGYAVNGGGFSNAIGSLRTKGFLEGDSARLAITRGGMTALGHFDPLPTGGALLAHWLGQLGRAERKALEALAEVYPRTLSKAQLANRAGYEANGGGFNNALGKLRTLELISGRVELKASDALFG